MQETWVQSLGWEDPLKKGIATHSRILAWRNPMDCSLPGSCYSPWYHKESDMTGQLRTQAIISFLQTINCNQSSEGVTYRDSNYIVGPGHWISWEKKTIWKVKVLIVQSCPILCNSPGKNTRVGNHSLTGKENQFRSHSPSRLNLGMFVHLGISKMYTNW